MRHPMHDLLERLLDAGRVAPGAEAADGWPSGRDNLEAKFISDPLAGAVGTLQFERSHDRHDLRGN